MTRGWWIGIRVSPWCDVVGLGFNDNRCEQPRDRAGLSGLCVGVGVASGGDGSLGCGVAAVAFGVESSKPSLPTKPALCEGEAESGVCVKCPVQSFPGSCGASSCGASRSLDGEVPTGGVPAGEVPPGIKLRRVASPLWLPLSLLLQ